jgi:hypothetical protein
MNCPVCGKATRVVDSRSLEGEVKRRRKCPKGHLSYTMQAPEYFVAGRAAGRPKAAEKKLPKPRKKIKPKKAAPLPYPPAMKEWGLAVTKDSPLWLKSIAMKLDER